MKDKIIFLLIGIIAGMLCIIILFIAFFGVNKVRPALSKAKGALTNITVPAVPTDTSKNIDFNLTFESQDEVEAFESDDSASSEASEAHSTEGKHSLMVTFPAGANYPGLSWEVYGGRAQDWSKAKDFHFDVFNNSEDSVNLAIKFKSGRNYPKKAYERNVTLEPLSGTKVEIPIEDLNNNLDIREISYLKLFIAKPFSNIILYFDNFGLTGIAKTKTKNVPLKSTVSQKEESKISAENLKPGFNISVATSLDKVLLDGKNLEGRKFSSNAELSLAKNEYESFQIIVQNGKPELKKLSIELDDLINSETGARIAKENLDYKFVASVKTQKPYYATKFIGMWPDPLIPDQTANVGIGITLPIWITLYVPENTPAGIYKGRIKVLSDNYPEKEVTISARVWDFALPQESHLKTAFDFYGHMIGKWYPAKQNETEGEWKERLERIKDEYHIDMLKHRINPILNLDPASADFMSKINTYRRYGLSNFAIGKRNGTFGNNWPRTTKEIQDLIPLYRDYGKILRETNLIEKSYIYTWDEGKIGEPIVKTITEMIHQADPKLKNMVCYHAFWDPDKDPEWIKDIDIWCFQIEAYNEKLKKKLENLGKEIWMYVSGPDGNYPNLAIDFPAIDPRIIPWMCWKYNIKGFLYWCVNWWTVNPYQSAANTKWQQNGNGLLYYPGKDGPVGSTRLKVLRDGMEDYEYLYMLAEKIKEAENKNSDSNIKDALNKAKNLLEIDNSIVSSLSGYTKNPEIIYKRRKDIAESIERLTSVLNGEIKTTRTAIQQTDGSQVTEDFSSPITAESGKSFGEYGQLTFELYRNGTFIIDGKSGFAWQKSDRYSDAAIIRSAKALPKTYKISVVVGEIDYDLEKIRFVENDPQYTEGPLNENGAYLLAITDEEPSGHHTNDWWHQHRKVCIDVDNNIWGHGMPHPIFMVFFDKNNELMALDGEQNKWQKEWKKAATYQPDSWYRVEIEKTEKSFNLYLYDNKGSLLKGGVIPFKYVFNEDGNHPDYLVIGDPHENYYQGSMKIKSISMPVEVN